MCQLSLSFVVQSTETNCSFLSFFDKRLQWYLSFAVWSSVEHQNKKLSHLGMHLRHYFHLSEEVPLFFLRFRGDGLAPHGDRSSACWRSCQMCILRKCGQRVRNNRCSFTKLMMRGALDAAFYCKESNQRHRHLYLLINCVIKATPKSRRARTSRGWQIRCSAELRSTWDPHECL